MENRVNIFKLLRQEKKLIRILIYPAKETENDPRYHTTTKTFMNPITIEALVRDLSPESLHWKYFGNLDVGSKEIICEKKHKDLMKSADKIKIDDTYYAVRKDSSQEYNIIERSDYIVVVAAIKNV